MDGFIKLKKQKLVGHFTDLGRCICVLGKTGIGKTWAVHNALGGNYVEITPYVLKSRQGTLDFLERLKSTDTPVVLDEYESVCDLVGIREINGPPSRGKFIIITQIPIEHKFSFEIVLYNFPVPTRDDIKKIAPGASDTLIQKANGDIRRVLMGLDFTSDEPDSFQSPKEFISSLVSKFTTKDPMKYITCTMSEPGNMVGILEENYVDSKGVDAVKVMDCMSDAQIFEEKMYNGAWELMPYYAVCGCIQPALEIGHRLNPDKMRPGSIWTKYQNMCMRRKRIKTISDRVPYYTVDIDSLILIRKYAEKGEYSLAQEYKLEPKDIDVLNHLLPMNKMKPKMIQDIKKGITPPPPRPLAPR